MNLKDTFSQLKLEQKGFGWRKASHWLIMKAQNDVQMRINWWE